MNECLWTWMYNLMEKMSQSIVFDKTASNIKPRFVVSGQVVECATEIKYLSHCICGNRSESGVKYIVKDFNKKVSFFYW